MNGSVICIIKDSGGRVLICYLHLDSEQLKCKLAYFIASKTILASRTRTKDLPANQQVDPIKGSAPAPI
jgi:hypothetical protein